MDQKPEHKRNYPDFGYQAAMEAALGAFSMGSRRSGRTEHLVSTPPKGSAIFISKESERIHLERLIREAGRHDELTIRLFDPMRFAPMSSDIRFVRFEATVIENEIEHAIKHGLDRLNHFDRLMQDHRSSGLYTPQSPLATYGRIKK